MKSTCLNCRSFRVKDVDSGFCLIISKKTGVKDAEKPPVTTEHCCSEWSDAGQQYFIRLGWIKNKKKEQNQPE